MLQEIIDQLFSKYNKNGYLSEDEVFNVVIKNNLSLFEVDKITGSLLSLGVIFRNKEAANKDEYIVDRSQIDYEAMYCEIIKIDGTTSPFIKMLRKIEPPKRNECNNLILQAKDGNDFAKNRIIEMYMRVAVRHAFLHHKKYKSPLSDNIQESLIGLVNAYEKYDTSKNESFLIYATSWIRQAITRNCLVGNPHIYIPVHVRDKMYTILDIHKQHSCNLCTKGRVCPNFIQEVSENTQWEKSDVVRFYALCEDMVSLDWLLEETENVYIEALCVNDETISEVLENDMKEAVHNILNYLSDREKNVLKQRFGFYDDREKTLEEIAKLEGVTRERIRQIEAKVMNKLQHNYKVSRLDVYIS